MKKSDVTGSPRLKKRMTIKPSPAISEKLNVSLPHAARASNGADAQKLPRVPAPADPVTVIAPVPTAITAFVGRALAGPLNCPMQVASYADYVRVFGGSSPYTPLGRAVEQFFHNGGAMAHVVRAGGTEGQAITDAMVVGDATHKTGIYALDNVALFNLLCIPPFAESVDPHRDTWLHAAAYCGKHGAILLVDPPLTLSGTGSATSDVLHWVADLQAALGPDHCRNAAAWFPRLRCVDPGNTEQVQDVAPGGAIAGIIARTDASHGVWQAPAGVEAAFRNIQGFTVQLATQPSGLLNDAALNVLRSFPGKGHLVWGARTLAGAVGQSVEWRYLPVRRLALFLKQSIMHGTQWAVFEPHAEPLWRELQSSTTNFMQYLFRRGAFQGRDPDEAYLVRCDRSLQTQRDIDQGIVNMLVGFAALKPAGFIMVNIRLSLARTPS